MLSQNRLLRRRWIFYVRYKTYSVNDDELCINPLLSMVQNYGALFLLQKRIQKCLDARIEVFKMYADDDLGHKQAILYTETQLCTVQKLLHDIYNEIKISNDQPPTSSSSDDTTIAKSKQPKKKKKKRSIPRVSEETLRAAGEAEWRVLEQVNEERIESFREVYRKIDHIIDTMDHSVVQPLRDMIAANADDFTCHCYIFQCIVGVALKHMIQAARDTKGQTFVLASTSLDALRRWNAAYPPSTDDLLSGVLHMCQVEIIPKSIVQDTILKQLLVGSRHFPQTAILRLSNYIMDQSFSIGGPYTTTGTTTTVASLIEAICAITMIHNHWNNQRTIMSVANVSGFKSMRQKYGDAYIIRTRNAIEHLVRVLDPSIKNRIHINWEILRRVPESMVALEFAHIAFGGDDLMGSTTIPFVLHIK